MSKTVEVNADVLADLIEQVAELKRNQAENQKKHNELNTTMDRWRRGEFGGEKPKIQEAPKVVKEPATTDGQMKENICPNCVALKQFNICDISRSGKWACRTCGKHWADWAIGQPYTLALEQGEREQHFSKLRHDEQLEIARSGQAVGNL